MCAACGDTGYIKSTVHFVGTSVGTSNVAYQYLVPCRCTFPQYDVVVFKDGGIMRPGNSSVQTTNTNL